MSSSLERNLVGILDKVRVRTNATFKRFQPVNPELGIYLDYNSVVSFNPASTRRLRGMRNIAIDQALGNTDPARRFLGHTQKLSGSLEHAVLTTVRSAIHRGIHATRIAEVDLLTGYGTIAHLALTHAEQFQLDQAQQHLPEIPVLSAALRTIGRSMAKVDLTTGLDDKTLATDKNGVVINRRASDILLTEVSGLLLESLGGSKEET